MFIPRLHIRTGHLATWAAMVVLDCWRQNPRCVRQAKMTLGWLLEELSSQAAHRPTTEFTSDFYPWQIHLKMRNRISQKQKQSGCPKASLWPILQPGSCTIHTELIIASTYLVNCRNYTERDLNLKWPNWGSSDITKWIFLCAQLEKAGCALTGI